MSEKMNISFRIRAVDNFSKTMARAQLQLKALENAANENMTAVINVKVLDDDAKKQLRALKNTKLKVNVDDASKDMKDFNKSITDVRKNVDKSVVVKVETDGMRDSIRLMDSFKKSLTSVRRTVSSVGSELGKMRSLFKDALTDMRKDISRLANIFRNVGELFQHSLISGLMMLAPIGVPAIASIAGALGGLLPIIGTVGGGIMAMATSFGLAGAGALAFGMVAKSALGDIFETSKDLKKLNDKLAKAKDEKERIKILHEIEHAQDGLTDKQKEGLKSLQALKGEWGRISGAIQPEVVDTFKLAMDGLTSVLKNIEPLFASVSTHAQNLVKWLNAQIDTDDVQAFYEMLNTSAGPSMERMTKAMSNFGIGIGNMMEAFLPLSVDFEKGFVKMSESFRDWSAGLSESKKFQAFVSYVKENGPKLLEVIGNIVGGLVGMGIAFAPFAEKMLDGLVEMTQKFQDWGNELKNNDGFQKFIKYVQENGPRFLDFMREFRDMLINIGIAFAPLGEKIMDLVTKLIELGNEYFENNRGMGELIAKIGLLTSAFMFFYPILMIAANGFKLLWSVLKLAWTWIKKLTPVWNFLIKAFRVAGPWLLRAVGFLIQFAGPIGMIIKLAVVLGGIWYTFGDDIKRWTKNMVDTVVKKFNEWGAKAEAAINVIKAAFNVLKNLNLFESGKKIIGSLIDGVKAMAGAVGRAIKNVVGPNLRDYLPFSPAKKGPLSDLDKLNFGGPIVDSILGDGPRIARAMNSMLAVPSVSDGGNSMGSAKANLNARRATTQTASATNAGSSEYYFEVPVVVDGREIARATAKFTQEELDRMKRDKNRASGRVSMA